MAYGLYLVAYGCPGCAESPQHRAFLVHPHLQLSHIILAEHSKYGDHSRRSANPERSLKPNVSPNGILARGNIESYYAAMVHRVGSSVLPRRLVKRRIAREHRLGAVPRAPGPCMSLSIDAICVYTWLATPSSPSLVADPTLRKLTCEERARAKLYSRPLSSGARRTTYATPKSQRPPNGAYICDIHSGSQGSSPSEIPSVSDDVCHHRRVLPIAEIGHSASIGALTLLAVCIVHSGVKGLYSSASAFEFVAEQRRAGRHGALKPALTP